MNITSVLSTQAPVYDHHWSSYASFRRNTWKLLSLWSVYVSTPLSTDVLLSEFLPQFVFVNTVSCILHVSHLYTIGPVLSWSTTMMTTTKNIHHPRYWPFVRGIHRSPVNSPHKGQWRGALMFSLFCKRLKKQWRHRWFETLSRPLWRHCNAIWNSSWARMTYLIICDRCIWPSILHLWKRLVLRYHEWRVTFKPICYQTGTLIKQCLLRAGSCFWKTNASAKIRARNYYWMCSRLTPFKSQNDKLQSRRGWQHDRAVVNDSAGDWQFHSNVIKWKHFPRYCPFVWGIHRSPVNSPTKGQ